MYSNLLVMTRGYAEDKPQLMVDALLGLVKEAGQDILRLWNAFLKEHPAALDAARSYGTDRCKLDDRVATEWTLRLGRLLKVEPQAAVKLKGIVEGVAEVCQGPG